MELLKSPFSVLHEEPFHENFGTQFKFSIVESASTRQKYISLSRLWRPNADSTWIPTKKQISFTPAAWKDFLKKVTIFSETAEKIFVDRTSTLKNKTLGNLQLHNKPV